jgi:hypothetical protein
MTSLHVQRINLGISRRRITLIPAMNIRLIIALFMGLVLQLSQMPGCLASQPAEPCATQAHAASCCCEGSKSCPCARETRENQQPAPLLPASVEVKLSISEAPEVALLAPLVRPPAAGMAVAIPAPGRSGYAGVPLSVAFCSFVI